MVAGLAGRHVEPALTRFVADRRHRTVAGLALHGVLAGCIHSIAHGTAQTLGVFARMAVVAGIASSDAVQGLASARQSDVGVAVMHSRSHIGDHPGHTFNSPNCKGIAVVTAVAQNWLAVVAC